MFVCFFYFLKNFLTKLKTDDQVFVIFCWNAFTFELFLIASKMLELAIELKTFKGMLKTCLMAECLIVKGFTQFVKEINAFRTVA